MAAKRNLQWGFGGVFLVFAVLFAYYGYDETWALWGVESRYARSPAERFGDLQAITGGAESYRKGYDPMVYNPGDPWQRRLNYPRIWQSFYSMGLNRSHTIPLALLFISLFFIGAYIFLPKMSNATACVLLAGICSPAVLFGIELGNVDLVMFFLLGLSIVLVRKHYVLATLSIWFAFALKLFPIFGVTILLRQKQQVFVRLCIITALLAGFYAWFTFNDLLLIYYATPKQTLSQYGVNVLWVKAVGWLRAVWGYDTEAAAKLVSYFVVVFILFRAVSNLWADKAVLVENEFELDAFRTGSAVYLGTFMLGNNFDYRLMFLLFTVPQLLSWARRSNDGIRRLSVLTLIAIYISFWDIFILSNVTYRGCHWQLKGGCIPWAGGSIALVVDELCNWTVFYAMAHLLFLSTPEWVRQCVRQLRYRYVVQEPNRLR